jgi:2-polyprenyl-3-methyl-5-hydroxy-6-metoxy-1,4-benzoquinol methylase
VRRIRGENINTLAYWDDRHSRADHAWNPEDIVAQIARFLRPRDIVLDVGVGSAVILRGLHALVRPLGFMGCDMSPVAIRKLRKARGLGLQFTRLFVHDVRQPLPGPLADVVICTELLEHLEDPAAALANLVELARRTVVVSIPVDGSIRGPEHLWAFSESDLMILLGAYGEPSISRARRGIHVVGGVDLRRRAG